MRLRLLKFLFLISFIFFCGCANNPVSFCRRAFFDLMKGNAFVAAKIDWDNFQAMGSNVGEAYRQFPDEKEKKDYRLYFIKAASFGFKQGKGNLSYFVNWRLVLSDAKRLIVAADHKKTPGKTLFFTVTKTKPFKLLSMNWDAP